MDIKLIENGDGGDFGFAGGDVIKDNTLFSAVYLSLFSGDAFYNIFVKYPGNKEFEDNLNCIITNDALRTIETKGKSALDWMMQEGLAESVEVSAYCNDRDRINVLFTVQEPSKEPQKYGLIWDAQKKALLGFGEVENG